jgi:hypothetical protein
MVPLVVCWRVMGKGAAETVCGCGGMDALVVGADMV